MPHRTSYYAGRWKGWWWWTRWYWMMMDEKWIQYWGGGNYEQAHRWKQHSQLPIASLSHNRRRRQWASSISRWTDAKTKGHEHRAMNIEYKSMIKKNANKKLGRKLRLLSASSIDFVLLCLSRTRTDAHYTLWMLRARGLKWILQICSPFLLLLRVSVNGDGLLLPLLSEIKKELTKPQLFCHSEPIGMNLPKPYVVRAYNNRTQNAYTAYVRARLVRGGLFALLLVVYKLKTCKCNLDGAKLVLHMYDKGWLCAPQISHSLVLLANTQSNTVNALHCYKFRTYVMYHLYHTHTPRIIC